MELEQNIEHTLLRHIRLYQITFKIRVCASRLWRPKKYNSDIYDGLHYLLVDEEAHAIHGLISESAYPYMSNKMEEGQVYDITNFYNRKPVSKYKVAGHMVEVCFNESTKFEPVMDAFPPIPEHSFNLLHFDNLEDQMRTQTVLKGCLRLYQITDTRTSSYCQRHWKIGIKM
ncbi:putative nucleic acid-binding protein [Rosa chinensis]|uniref:Putative nucleic acid-binding protein n=1 Tax=Rosa chinensis TaxID=74649 RepID=A0A2P6P3B2_ROSCH|nr:putative nucleic acid-binding protein [Rosa chinensis]